MATEENLATVQSFIDARGSGDFDTVATLVEEGIEFVTLKGTVTGTNDRENEGASAKRPYS